MSPSPFLSPENIPHHTPVSTENIGPEHEPILFEVDYPMKLRDDSLATTYVDPEGTTYLHPTIKHDYHASISLEEAGLSSGEVVTYYHKPIAVKYSPDTDLVILSAIFNASVDLEHGSEDIVESLVHAGELLNAAKKQCGFVPRNLDMDNLAIDRSRGTAELLLPFNVDTVSSPQQAFGLLKEDAFKRIISQAHTPIITACFDMAVRRLGWE